MDVDGGGAQNGAYGRGVLGGNLGMDSNNDRAGGGLIDAWGSGEGGGASGAGGSNGSSSRAPRAYWDINRRQGSLSGLVFPNKAPDNTEEIYQPDPNLAGEPRKRVQGVVLQV